MSNQKNSANSKQSAKETNPYSFKNYIDENEHVKATEIDLLAAKPPQVLGDDQNNPFSFKNFIEKTSDTGLPNVNELPDVDTPLTLPPPLPLDLPEIAQDFIPDLDWDNDKHATTSSLSSSSAAAAAAPADETRSRIERLEKENAECNKTISKQHEMIAKLEKRLKSLMEKEENENKTLELVVQQVEKSLEEATKRAVASESTVELLRIEISQLKSQVKALSNENLILKATNLNTKRSGLFVTIGEIANEINEAALAAENSLTYLGAGVSTLRLIASRLQSLEKISEII